MGFKRRFQRRQEKSQALPGGMAYGGTFGVDGQDLVWFDCALCGQGEEMADDLHNICLQLFGVGICQRCLAASLAENFLPRREARPGLAIGRPGQEKDGD